jgi:hypothetical protein
MKFLVPNNWRKKSPNVAVGAPSTGISYGRRGITAEELALANKIK